jgi:hypothetical protein
VFQRIYTQTARFYEIAPNWANKILTLRQEGFPFPLSLSWWKLYFALDSPSKCIVGEAHGFSSHYERECAECDRLGWEFGHSCLIRSTKNVDDNIEEFVAHWNDKHISEKEMK